MNTITFHYNVPCHVMTKRILYSGNENSSRTFFDHFKSPFKENSKKENYEYDWQDVVPCRGLAPLGLVL